MNTIPDGVLEKIINHRPHMRSMVTNLKNASSRQMVTALERAIANAYLSGTTELTAMETWRLSFCCMGEPYGGWENLEEY